MRKSMQWIIVAGEVLLFGLCVASLARAAEYPPLRPTYVPVQNVSSSSPYSHARPVRVTLTNKDGQVTTLEYRKPVELVARHDYDSELVPVTSLPVLSSPAREEDLVRFPEISEVRHVRYAGQPVTQPAFHQTNYQPAPACNCPQPMTAYSLPNYSQPVMGSPYTMYSPVAAPMPAYQSNVQVGTGIYGQPVIYRPGQPVRNAWRWLTP